MSVSQSPNEISRETKRKTFDTQAEGGVSHWKVFTNAPAQSSGDCQSQVLKAHGSLSPTFDCALSISAWWSTAGKRVAEFPSSRKALAYPV